MKFAAGVATGLAVMWALFFYERMAFMADLMGTSGSVIEGGTVMVLDTRDSAETEVWDA